MCHILLDALNAYANSAKIYVAYIIIWYMLLVPGYHEVHNKMRLDDLRT